MRTPWAMTWASVSLRGGAGHGDHHIGGAGAHEPDGLAQEEDLDFVTGFGERLGVEEGQGRSAGIVGSPCALEHDAAHGVCRFHAGIRW
jgi:hypothetical protein